MNCLVCTVLNAVESVNERYTALHIGTTINPRVRSNVGIKHTAINNVGFFFMFPLLKRNGLKPSL